MAKETERRVLALVRKATGARKVEQCAPPWLVRPGRLECKHRWGLICQIYHALTGAVLREVMPSRESRRIDGTLELAGQPLRIIEVDEYQHFSAYRATTLRHYPKTITLAFDRESWIEWSEETRRLSGGNFAKPCPPLFPDAGGRHRQRAFRDALCDLLPPVHGLLPTLRIAEREVRGWIHERGARRLMSQLLEERGVF
jgi:hypothetical protein